MVCPCVNPAGLLTAGSREGTYSRSVSDMGTSENAEEHPNPDDGRRGLTTNGQPPSFSFLALLAQAQSLDNCAVTLNIL